MKNKYEIFGDVAEIYIRRRNGDLYKVLVDSEDIPRLLEEGGSWCVDGGKDAKRRYAIKRKIINGKSTTIKMHRFLTNAPSGKVVDHINHNTLDNRKVNLRVTTHLVNMQNIDRKSETNLSGIRGLTYIPKKGLWYARVMRNGFQMQEKSKDRARAEQALREMLNGTWKKKTEGRGVRRSYRCV